MLAHSIIPYESIEYPLSLWYNKAYANFVLYGDIVKDSKTKKPNGISLTEGSLFKNILLFSLPLMLSNVLQVLFNMADIAVVGQFVGPVALGSVGSTATLVTLFTGFLIGLGGGINAVVARRLGEGRHKAVSDTVHTASIVCAVTGIIICAVCFFFSEGILKLLGTKDELIDGAVIYLKIYAAGIPASAIFNFGNGVLSAAGNTGKPLFILSVAGFINVLLNLFFVVVIKLDVAGVAIASAVSQYVSAVLILISLFKSRKSYRLSLHRIKFHLRYAGDILKLGIPSGMQYAIFQIANLFIQMGVNSFDHVVVEGNSAAANADALVYDVMAAFYTACTSFMAQNFGAGKRKRVLRSYFICLLYSFGAGALFGISVALAGEAFLGIFTSDSAVIEVGMMRLKIMGFSYCVSAFMDCTIAASRGLGRSIVPTAGVIAGSCVFRIIWIYTVFAYFKTIPSLYLLYVCSWTLTAIFETIYFVFIYKKQIALLDS